MPVFDLPEPEVNQHAELAKGMLQFANQVGDELVRLYRMSGEMMWARQEFKIADAQSVIDAMGDNAPKAFMLHAALGEFIATYYPEALKAEELETPVKYEVESGRIVLDKKAKYPTEKEPEVEGIPAEVIKR